MKEIRPIESAEADEFLTLLCESFDLDFVRARNVFFREPLYDLQRKWAYVRNGKIDSILTTVPLKFGWGNAIGIAGVTTRLPFRGQGLARELLSEVISDSRLRGEAHALLFAKSVELYEQLGFRVLDEVIRAPVRARAATYIPPALDVEQVVGQYDAWALGDADRLRRDEKRWRYWRWNLRVCYPMEPGYICVEGGVVRECIVAAPVEDWPVSPGTEWLGLRTMARLVGAPIADPSFELYLMGYGFERAPQMFMTDQF